MCWCPSGRRMWYVCNYSFQKHRLIICLGLFCGNDTKHHPFKSQDELLAIIISGCTNIS